MKILSICVSCIWISYQSHLLDNLVSEYMVVTYIARMQMFYKIELPPFIFCTGNGNKRKMFVAEWMDYNVRSLLTRNKVNCLLNLFYLFKIQNVYAPNHIRSPERLTTISRTGMFFGWNKESPIDLRFQFGF